MLFGLSLYNNGHGADALSIAGEVAMRLSKFHIKLGVLLALLLSFGQAWAGPQLIPVDQFVAFNAMAIKDGYMYGTRPGGGGSAYQLQKKEISSGTMTALYNFTAMDVFGADNELGADADADTMQCIDLEFAADGSLLAVAKVVEAGHANLNKNYIFKSTDSGVTFSATPVLILGNTDGSIANQISSVSVLFGYSLSLASTGTMYLGEYNVNGSRTNGGANDQVRLLKSTDNGSTWSEVAHWNTDGSTHQVDHIHSVDEDPYTGDIYISFGDDGDEVGIIKLDGSATLSSNIQPKNYVLVTHGGIGIGGAQRYRAMGVMFTASYIHWPSDTDTENETGAWRVAKASAFDEANVTRQYTDIGANIHSWGGGKVGNTLIFSDADNDSDPAKIYLYTSNDDGTTYEKVGYLGAYTSRTDASYIQRILTDGTYAYIETTHASGESAYLTLKLQIGSEFAETIPDILSPCYWVSTTGNDTTGNGQRPSTAWATPKKALTGDNLVRGARLFIGPGAYDADTDTTFDWDADYATGTINGDPPTVIEGSGKTSTFIRKISTAENTLFWNIGGNDGTDELGQIIIKKLTLGTNRTTDQRVLLVQQDGDVVIEDTNIICTFDNSTSPLVEPRGSILIRRCYLQGPNNPTNNSFIVIVNGDGGEFTSYNSVLDGGYGAVYFQKTGSKFHAFNSSFVNYKNKAFDLVSTLDAEPNLQLKNCVFAGLSGAEAGVDNNTTTETDAMIDYCIFKEAKPVTFENINTHGAWGVDPLLTATFAPQPGSPAIDAGVPTFTAAQFQDYSGNTKVYGSAPDIGAYEFKSLISGGAGKMGGGKGAPRFIFDYPDICASTNAACYVQP